MPTFKEWLEAEAAKSVNPAEQKRRVEEWQQAVAALYERIRRWVKEDDPRGVLKVTSSYIDRNEEELGKYTVPTLAISLRDRHVDLFPVARRVIGGVGQSVDPPFRPEGRVDLDSGRKYMLYRTRSGDEDRWLIMDDDRYRIEELTKESFEAALQALLS